MCVPPPAGPRPGPHARPQRPPHDTDALGIVLGNVGIQNPTTYAVVNNISTASVVLSLPLLLFSTDIRQVRRKGLKVFIALMIGAFAVVASATACHFLFRSKLTPDAWKVRARASNPAPTLRYAVDVSQITALMTAVLVGGTPNMASVRTALSIDNELYVTVHTAEVVVGAIYVLLVMVRRSCRFPESVRTVPLCRPG